MASNRLAPVLLWRDPDFALRMTMRSSGWQALEGEPAYERRKLVNDLYCVFKDFVFLLNVKSTF